MERAEGHIHVAEDVVATIAGSVAVECEGIIGMVSRNRLREGIAELLGRDTLTRGIEVLRQADRWHVRLHVIVRYGCIISEVARTCQKNVHHALADVCGIPIDHVDIFVQGVRLETESTA